MMDQILAGPPQSPPVQPTYRDQQSASGTGGTEGGDSFQDYVSRANQQETPNGGRDSRHGAVEDDAAASATTDDPSASTVATPADAVRRNVAESTESRIRLALLKQSQKAAVAPDAGKDGGAEKALANILDVAKRMAQKVAAEAGNAAIAQDVAASPSEELSMLLGLAPTKETATKAVKKHDDDTEKADVKDETTAVPTDKKAEILLLNAHENAAATTKRDDHAHGKDEPATESVRLVSADGKGRPIDVPLTKSGTDGVADTDKRSNATKFDTATVIEARRYLGFSTETNTQTLTSAIKSDTTWTEALAHVNRAELSLEGDTVKEVNTLKLQMNPGDLGNMVASLKLKGDELSVEVRVDTIEAYRHLSNDQGGIVKALQDQGFSIDKVSVQLNATERTEANSDRDLARQDQGQKDNQASGRNENARQGNQDSWTRDEDAGISTSADSRTDSSRAGNIYL
ncbi:flagellar hook-length control protein FliK [Rhizobium sp. LjRoot254]|uniref:flagellar hook-length control protein FliK n=1 Tax=Rhizobium sp. LjRoot254 TaxID=3342297 RepID=UPI003ECF1EA5